MGRANNLEHPVGLSAAMPTSWRRDEAAPNPTHRCHARSIVMHTAVIVHAPGRYSITHVTWSSDERSSLKLCFLAQKRDVSTILQTTVIYGGCWHRPAFGRRGQCRVRGGAVFMIWYNRRLYVIGPDDCATENTDSAMLPLAGMSQNLFGSSQGKCLGLSLMIYCAHIEIDLKGGQCALRFGHCL